MSLVLSKLIVTFHLSSVVPKKVELLKKTKSDAATLKILR